VKSYPSKIYPVTKDQSRVPASV